MLLDRVFGGLQRRQIKEQFGRPDSVEEAARWAGWCRSLQRSAGVKILTGPNSGLSGAARRTCLLKLSFARSFGFVPGRLLSAGREALEVLEASAYGRTLLGMPAYLGVSEPWLEMLSPSPRRTRRNVRRWLAERIASAMRRRLTGEY